MVNMEPGSTDIQDVVYYKVTIALSDTDKPIQPGMTANVKIKTDFKPQVLIIPLRSVHTDNENKKFVRVSNGTGAEDIYVKLGMKGDGGKVEVLAGLDEGREVIVSVIKK